MKGRHLLALVALIPAALNAAPAAAAAAAGRALLVPVCTGTGMTRMVPLPGGTGEAPQGDPAGFCVKGCHAGGSRKRAARNFAQPQ